MKFKRVYEVTPTAIFVVMELTAAEYAKIIEERERERAKARLEAEEPEGAEEEPVEIPPGRKMRMEEIWGR